MELVSKDFHFFRGSKAKYDPSEDPARLRKKQGSEMKTYKPQEAE